MDNIKKGDEITMKYWNPNSFVRVGWVHYESDGRVSIAGVNNKGQRTFELVGGPMTTSHG